MKYIKQKSEKRYRCHECLEPVKQHGSKNSVWYNHYRIQEYGSKKKELTSCRQTLDSSKYPVNDTRYDLEQIWDCTYIDATFKVYKDKDV